MNEFERPAIPELNEDFPGEPWTETFFPPLEGRIDDVMRNRLQELKNRII